VTAPREELEAERDFLLRSLDDLDEELLAGNIDPDNYRTLHDDYTARASAVIRSIDDGRDRELPGNPRASKTLRAITFAGIVVFCVLGAFLLAHAIGPRGADQTPTGNDNAAPAAGGSPKDAVTANPRDYNARITYARSLLGTGDYANSVVQYTEAIALDHTKPEPFAYRGWLSALVAMRVSDTKERALLVQQATSDLNQAIALDSRYADAYAFKGVMLLRVEHKPAAAVPVLQQFLVLTPSGHPMREQVVSTLADAEAQAQSTKP
jgi:tetratricopeptide (TPR) repeat protein